MTQYTLHTDKIVQGTVFTLTFVFIILSLTMKYEICCPKEKDSEKTSVKNYQQEMEEAFSGDFENKLGKENKKPTCYCVWNNALGTGIMTIILFLLMVCAIFAPENPIDVNIFSGDDMKNLFLSIFSSFSDGFKKFMKLFMGTLGPLTKMAFKFLMGLLLLGGLILLLKKFSNTVYSFINIFIIVSVLAIIYKYTKGTFTSKLFKLGFTFIFFIPCLLRDFVTYMHEQLRLTTSIEWTILLIDIVVITMYFVLPILYEKIMTSRGTLLENGPVFTNEETVIQSKETLQKRVNKVNSYNPDVIPNSASSKKNNNYNYAISLWSYINPQPPNTSVAYENFTTIFNYNQKPKILYRGKTNELQILTQNKDSELQLIYETDKMPLQRWNHFLINYNGGTLDIFINSKLVHTVEKIFSKQNNGTITIGTDDGVDGGICNIIYFPTTLNINEIRTFYYFLKHKSPPII